MDIKAAFGQVLREHRKRTGLSQERMALECELDRTYISLLERGQRQPTLSTLFVLARILEVDPATLIQETQDRINS